MENKKIDDTEFKRELEKRKRLARAESVGEFLKWGYRYRNDGAEVGSPDAPEDEAEKSTMPSYRQRWGI